MSDPSFDHVVPSFKVGKAQNFRIEGDGFSEDDGNGNFAQIVIDLEDGNGVFQWKQTAAHPPQLLTNGKLVVRAKPTRINAMEKGDPRAGVGSGDLTITITNGDGSKAGPVSTTVLYDESADN